MAEIDLADAEHTDKRRPHQFLADQGLGLGDLGIRLVELRLVGIDIGLGLEFMCGEVARAREIGLREMRLRLVIREVAALRPVIDLDEGIARLDRRAGLEEIRVTRPATSGAMMTWCSAVNEPMLGRSRGIAIAIAVAAATGSGGGTLWAKKVVIARSRNRSKA